MKEQIIKKATDLFLKLGFKSVTMDDIASAMCISKKTIYKYFTTKEDLIEQGTTSIHQKIITLMNAVVSKNYNAIKENFEMRKMFKEMFQTFDHSPAYQLKKHYPEIYDQLISNAMEECRHLFRKNIEKGIAEGLYRDNVEIDAAVRFYYTLIFDINGNVMLEKEAYELEAKALEYHTRAIATLAGIQELEKQIAIYN
jgi:AcrR family transcriptional regulator